MDTQASPASVQPNAVHIDFPYRYSVGGLDRIGTVSCNVDERELVRTSSPSPDSRNVP